uniref:Uncharacterized protein n=1 Tax=Zea mays TaxID=4577 RepID=A0A804LYZ0_MAIZE
MSHRPPAPMLDTLSDAFAAAVLLSSTDKSDTLPPGRLSPVSPLLHSSKHGHHHPTPSSSSGSSGSVSRAPIAPASGLASRRSHSGVIPLPSDAPPPHRLRPTHLHIRVVLQLRHLAAHQRAPRGQHLSLRSPRQTAPLPLPHRDPAPLTTTCSASG